MLEFDDILSAICTEVTPAHVNDFQKIYVLENSTEAKLAYDILIALGFDAKVYHNANNRSKLYITNPTQSPEQLEELLADALAYAQALKNITIGLVSLCETKAANDFTMTFTNTQAGKQILIQIASQPNNALQTTNTSPAIAQEVPKQNVAAVAKMSSSQPRVAKKIRKPKDEDEFATGPAVGRGVYPTKILPEGGTKKLSLRQRIFLKIFGNFATSGYATLMWLVVAAVVFSFFVFAKSWLCYDFVAKKSTKWYCQDPNQIAAEEERKQKEQEERKKIGLQ